MAFLIELSSTEDTPRAYRSEDNLMSVHIELSRADVTCLANRLPLGSNLRYTLLNSDTIPTSVGPPIGDSSPFDCDEGEARALLRIAVDYCPEAVKNIQYAMRMAGVRLS